MGFVTDAVELPSALDSLWQELEDFLGEKKKKGYYIEKIIISDYSMTCYVMSKFYIT